MTATLFCICLIPYAVIWYIAFFVLTVKDPLPEFKDEGLDPYDVFRMEE